VWHAADSTAAHQAHASIWQWCRAYGAWQDGGQAKCRALLCGGPSHRALSITSPHSRVFMPSEFACNLLHLPRVVLHTEPQGHRTQWLPINDRACQH
jgi:hypothetical protein